MTLSDLCDPIFHYVCRLNRSARLGGRHEMDEVRSDVVALLAEAKQRAERQGGELAQQFGRVRQPLVFFVDSMIRNGHLPFAYDWQDLAFEEQEMAGEEKFFILLDAALRDKSPAAVEVLKVFYTCLGLGFTGWHVGQPDKLRTYQRQIAGRIKSAVDADPANRLCEDAYIVDATVLDPGPTKQGLTGIVLFVVVMAVAVLAANLVLYRDASGSLGKVLEDVRNGTPAAK